MKDIFVKDLESQVKGQSFDSTFRVDEITEKTTKANKTFWILTLTDKTGSVPAKVWDEYVWDGVPPVSRGDYVKVRAETSTYKGKVDVKITKIRQLDPTKDGADFSYEDFVPVGPLDRFKLMTNLQQWAEYIEHPGLRAVVLHIFKDEQLHMAFRDAPAAVKIHQAYIGGLAEHVSNLTRLAYNLKLEYNISPLSYDLLIAACFLHDIGKTREIKWSQGIAYTAEGELIGHVGIGMEMLEQLRVKYWEAWQPNDMPKDGEDWKRKLDAYSNVWLHLRHIVASHHGQLEWRAIAVPQSMEANLFHLIDMIESRHGMMEAILAKETFDEEGFTPFNNRLGGRVWRMPE